MKICINDDPSSTGDAGGYWGFYPDAKHVRMAVDCCLAFREAIREIRQSVEFVGASFFTAEVTKDGGQHIKGQPAIRLKVVMKRMSPGPGKKIEVEFSNWDELHRNFLPPWATAVALKGKLLHALEVQAAQLKLRGELLAGKIKQAT
ncbi:MAG: hypothetical protein Q7R94_01810 [bacterium]|nr:hypothetical protein [bacterium]